MTEQPGFKAMNYGHIPGMKSVFMYIIVYDQKANLGFPQGIHLQTKFPFLKGSGKTHRHVDIDDPQLNKNLDLLIQTALLQFNQSK
jgi:hypothetical protein